jgi:hypothetical protein
MAGPTPRFAPGKKMPGTPQDWRQAKKCPALGPGWKVWERMPERHVRICSRFSYCASANAALMVASFAHARFQLGQLVPKLAKSLPIIAAGAQNSGRFGLKLILHRNMKAGSGFESAQA